LKSNQLETLAESVVQLKKLREQLRWAELENHYLRELLRGTAVGA
jgi:hypothetical protein